MAEVHQQICEDFLNQQINIVSERGKEKTEKGKILGARKERGLGVLVVAGAS